MKVTKWKVFSLAGAFALGCAVTTNAAQIKVSDDTWANFGLNLKVWYKNLDERGKSDWKKNVFDVDNARIYFTGQVNKLVQFYADIDSNSATSGGITTLHEAGVNFSPTQEVQILVGKIRKSFTRADLTDDYAQLIPSGVFYDPQNNNGGNVNILTYNGVPTGGAMVHGDLFNNIVTYRVGIYNTSNEVSTRSKMFKGVEWNARVEFQPLMLGFKPESAGTITSKLADSYLGQKDILTVGVGYTKGYTLKRWNKDEHNDGWTIDATIEKKYSCYIPNFQVGYVKINNSHINPITEKAEDSKAWYIQTQILYDKIIGIGKPALALRYDSTTNNNAVDVNGFSKDAKLNRLGIAFNYYVKGQDARIALGYDYTKYKNGSKDILKSSNLDDSISDWYLYLQTKF